MHYILFTVEINGYQGLRMALYEPIPVVQLNNVLTYKYYLR